MAFCCPSLGSLQDLRKIAKFLGVGRDLAENFCFCLAHLILRSCRVNIMGNRRSRINVPRSQKPGHKRQRAVFNTTQMRVKVVKHLTVPDIHNKSAELSDIIEQIPLPPVKLRVRHAKILVDKQNCLPEATTYWDVCITLYFCFEILISNVQFLLTFNFSANLTIYMHQFHLIQSIIHLH
jgi:hypothetical protein